MSALAMSLRLLRREWRSGEMRALAGALIVAVTAMTAVGFFTSRVERALVGQASELMAADLVVSSSETIDPQLRTTASEYHLRTARTLSFASVVVANDRVVLTAIKAVSASYPLRGTLRMAEKPYGEGRVARALPEPGSVWLESRLAAALGVGVGDRLAVGERKLMISGILTYEPDRAGEIFSVAPRLLMRLQDVPGTGLLAPGSRVKHRLLLAGQGDDVQRYRAWTASRVQPPAEVEGVGDSRPELRAALDRGQRFLGLAALVAVLLAAVAIAISAQRFAQRHLDQTAIMRALGATQRLINRTYLLQLTWLGLGCGLLGTLAGLLSQSILARLLRGLAVVQLPAPGILPAVAGVAAGLLILYAFAVPPLLALARVSPARVLRRDLVPPSPSQRAVYGSALLAAVALVLWQAQDTKLALLFLLGASVTLALLGIFAWLLVRLLQPLRRRVGVSWRFGLANIVRRSRTSTVQVLGFGLGIMALLLLTLVRGDLLGDWRASLPEDAPNQFAINIQTEQLPALRQWFESHHRQAPQLYPMVRGRLLKINDHVVHESDYSEPRAQRLATREFNLSWSEHLHAGNKLAAGNWWGSAHSATGQWSVEQGIAQTLGIHVGDQLTYRIADRELTARVSSLRTVNWESFRPNFFVIAPPGMLDDFPATWISSFRLAANDKDLLTDLVARFPNVTIIDVEAVMAQVRDIMDQVASAVEYVFGFTLLAGLVVLYAAIQATQDERLREGAILRTLGASRRRLVVGVASEFVIIGLLAGLLAAFGATLAAYMVATQLLDLPFTLRPLWWLAGMLGGGLGVGLAGIIGTRQVLRQPPLQTLRKT